MQKSPLRLERLEHNLWCHRLLDKPWISGNIPRALAGYSDAGPYAKWLKVGKNPHTQETREYMDATRS